MSKDENFVRKIEEAKNKREKINIIMSSKDYVLWLINFMKDKNIFSDDEWDYSCENLNDIDQKMVNVLSVFFDGIYLYARDNYIYSLSRPFGECYHIKIDNNGFEIGYLSGQGTCFYCKKIQLDKDNDFIDIMDIINNRKQDNVEFIDMNLNNLSSLIIDLYNNGVPIEAIINTFDKTIHYINNEEQVKNNVKKHTLVKNKDI